MSHKTSYTLGAREEYRRIERGVYGDRLSLSNVTYLELALIGGFLLLLLTADTAGRSTVKVRFPLDTQSSRGKACH